MPKIKSIIRDVAIVAVGAIIIWLGIQWTFGTQNPFYVVSSGSMVPHLLVYDIIVVQGNDPFEDVAIGDVIVFNRPTGEDRVIVHRVVAITDDDPYTVRTQGDANHASIPGTDFPITAEEYIGTVQYVIPQVGFITRVFAYQIGGIPLNYILIAIIIGAMITKQFLFNKTKKDEDGDNVASNDRRDDDDDDAAAATTTDTPNNHTLGTSAHDSNSQNKSDISLQTSKNVSDKQQNIEKDNNSKKENQADTLNKP